MLRDAEKLLATYSDLESSLPVESSLNQYSQLVTAVDSSSYPVQRWYRFKEAFSLELLPVLLEEWKIAPATVRRILDPFCGVGTSFLAAQMLAKRYSLPDLQVIGFERNPFIHFVAETKANWFQFSPDEFADHACSLLCQPLPDKQPDVPDFSSFQREHIFERELLNRILKVRNTIFDCAGSSRDLSLLLLGFASILEAVSRARKDGRALRIEPRKQRPDLIAALAGSWTLIEHDLRVASEHYSSIQTRVVLGDGRRICEYAEVELGDFDLIFYSPPYLNNIDYTEVYKIELWLCKFIASRSEFRNLRRSTFRSHPSLRFSDPVQITSDPRMEKSRRTIYTVVQALPRDKNLVRRSLLFLEYFDDMYISLREQIKVLRPGGWIFVVVGNSHHGPANLPGSRLTVASDLIIAQIGICLGLVVKRIQVARHPGRRGKEEPFLRESIVIFQKPE